MLVYFIQFKIINKKDARLAKESSCIPVQLSFQVHHGGSLLHASCK